jgi:folate-dependent phosphoribosylglycinamide formyltransferase PurN
VKTKKPRILVLASGDAESGGSGFQELVEFSRTTPAVLDADIVAVVSNHEFGGVRKRADKLGITFELMQAPWTAEKYRALVKKYKADYVMCSGWLKPVRGLPTKMVVNIHPEPLPETAGLHGDAVHQKVIELGLKQTAVTMHYVPDFDEAGYDTGERFFVFPMIVRDNETWEELKGRVNERERALQAYKLNQVVHEHIVLHDGKVHYRDNNPKQLFF